MAMPTLRRHWTVDDLQTLPDDGNRYEIIDGELYVTPSPSWAHQRAVTGLFRMLDSYFERTGIGTAYVAPADVAWPPHRVVQPDLFVIPRVVGPLPRSFLDVGRLLLAVEILSPATARVDRVVKRTIYAEQGVPEYWIVDLDSRLIERSTPDEARPELIDGTLVWHPTGASEPLTIDVQAYFARVLDG